jgi:carbonic anhydrase
MANIMGTRDGSIPNILSKMRVGDRWYKDTTKNTWQSDMRKAVPPKNRLPEKMRYYTFSVSALTAVSARGINDVRYLILIERTQ